MIQLIASVLSLVLLDTEQLTEVINLILAVCTLNLHNLSLIWQEVCVILMRLLDYQE